jgi:hypothetical protein
MSSNVTINIRETTDFDAPKSISCLLRKGSTYHPWNKKRVISDRLEFISFTRIVIYEIKESFITWLERQTDNSRVALQFNKGNRWSFLAALSEGLFLMKFDDTIYISGQGFYEKSIEVDAPLNSKPRKDDERHHEWMKLKCANGTVGWIFFNEIRNAPGFSGPHTDGYGRASDL